MAKLQIKKAIQLLLSPVKIKGKQGTVIATEPKKERIC